MTEDTSLIETDWYRLEDTGVEFYGVPPPFEEFQSAVLFWAKLNRLTTWVLADLIRYGEKKYGETYAQAISATGLSVGRISNIVSVANRIPVEQRRGLPFGHHATVAYMPEEDRNKWLDRAEQEDFTREELREAIRAEVTVSSNGVDSLATPVISEMETTEDGLSKLSVYDLVVEYVRATETGLDSRSNIIYEQMKRIVGNSL